jgi:hypothetical protein
MVSPKSQKNVRSAPFKIDNAGELLFLVLVESAGSY